MFFNSSYKYWRRSSGWIRIGESDRLDGEEEGEVGVHRPRRRPAVGAEEAAPGAYKEGGATERALRRRVLLGDVHPGGGGEHLPAGGGSSPGGPTLQERP